MKLHPRTLPRCLLEVTQDITKYQLRGERHPDDPERKADEA